MKKNLPTLAATLRGDLPLVAYIGLCIVAFGVLVIPARSFQLIGTAFSSAKTDEKVIALTFDDGPQEKHLGEVLKTLDQNDVRATFFLLGSEIEKNPAAGLAIAKSGHEIGNHGYSHQSLVFLAPSVLDAEITETDRLIRGLGYDGAIPFRPPYGHKFIMLPWYLEQRQRVMVMWSLAPDDHYKEAADMTEYVLEEVKPGSIIIMHIMEDHRAESRAALKQFIPALKAKGYRFVTVSELISLSR